MIETISHFRMSAMELEEFLKHPPECFSVKTVGSSHLVQNRDDDNNLVFIDSFESSKRKIVFQNSLGRKVKMLNLWEYSSMRNSLLSKKIYLLVSACEQNLTKKESKVLKHYVLCINGGDPYIRWQMQKGLDMAISTVAGEGYRVIIDFTESLERLAANGLIAENLTKHRLVWRDAFFTLKYHSDALFDFPHWFGLSKRTFQVRLTRNGCE